ncbi:unnamed protein product [Alternaria alternata]
MSVSRITPSLIAASNENTVALVNVNADFSLIKLEAPNEFKDLGRSLTHHRRELAEEGAVHRTARRLGALFESIAPLSPLVIKAYGARVSEISRSHTNENSATRHGVFADCIGMDGTSVWAAATSGKSAITVHLLACMLARAWSGSQATSIWVEIVEARRQELRKQIHEGMYNDYTQVGLAVSADLTRTDLAQWDASARSWLQVADDELIRRQKQLMLIINNINMPVNHGTSNFSTYARVVEAWKTAVEALEKLLQGQPQRLSKGSVLLGLASWHLYPDLLILGESVTAVDFKDPVIADCAQLTIGLWNPDIDKDEGVYWSLSLSHLRFYGDPVKVTSITTRDASRLDIEELHLLTMGAFLADWGNLRASDFTQAAHFFVALDNAVCNDKGSPLNIDLDWSWIHLFGDASRKFLALPDTERTAASTFIALGHRRGHSLLSRDTAQIPPIMGLCHPWIQQILRADMGDIPYFAHGAPGKDMAVEMMRKYDQKGPNFVLIAGSVDHVALLVRTDSGVRARKSRLKSAQRRAQTEPLHTVEQVTQAITAGQLPAKSLATYFISLRHGNQIAVPTLHKGLVVKTFTVEPYLRSLRALSLATETFKDLPGSTISLGIISTPLHDALWLPSTGVQRLNRQQKFSCIAMFESGTYNIEPTALDDVIAISSRNSIFTSKLLHHDPSSIEHKDDITRVIGNVGKTGMVLMVAPQAPRLRKIDLNNFRLVSHAPFDGKSEDSFRSTSLHLRFTEFEMAFDVGQRGAIDKDLCLVETLIQVYDRDEWIADIDVLPLFNEGNDAIRRNNITCTGCSLASQSTDIPSWLVSVDNWEELLDAPKGLGKLNVAVFRAHDNWIARLAAACISLQRGFRIVINPVDKVCWGCCCRKKWGWSAETLSLSRHAALNHLDSEDLDDNDCEDSDEGDSSDSSESDTSGSPRSDSSKSDTSGSPHSETLTESDTSLSNLPDLETGSMELSSYTGLVQEALRKMVTDPGYESDDTVFNVEGETQLHHMPQVFIL